MQYLFIVAFLFLLLYRNLQSFQTKQNQLIISAKDTSQHFLREILNHNTQLILNLFHPYMDKHFIK